MQYRVPPASWACGSMRKVCVPKEEKVMSMMFGMEKISSCSALGRDVRVLVLVHV